MPIMTSTPKRDSSRRRARLRSAERIAKQHEHDHQHDRLHRRVRGERGDEPGKDRDRAQSGHLRAEVGPEIEPRDRGQPAGAAQHALRGRVERVGGGEDEEEGRDPAHLGGKAPASGPQHGEHRIAPAASAQTFQRKARRKSPAPRSAPRSGTKRASVS